MSEAVNLPELLAKVQGASGPDRKLDRDLATGLGEYVYERRGRDRNAWFYPVGQEWFYRKDRPPAYSASLDAALALLERKLPGWGWGIGTVAGSGFLVALIRPLKGIFSAEAPTPALALLAALIQAIISQGGENA